MKIFTDGAARGNPGPAAAGFVVVDEQGKVLYQQGRSLGRTTNNVAEYQAVIMAWRWLIVHRQSLSVNFYLDSLLVVNQLNGRFKIKDKKLRELAVEVKRLGEKAGVKASYAYIPREKNILADQAVNQTLDHL